MLTAAMLTQIMPKLSQTKATEYLPHLLAGMAEFGINNELRIAAYLSQLAQESTQLTHWVENLNYSAARLCQVWPRRFPTIAEAALYAHNPEGLANKVYGGRRDLGNTQPGDGWRFRGRMPMQATGRGMYVTIGELLGIDLTSKPDISLQPEIAFRASACIFARIKNCNALADGLIQNPNNLVLITKLINGGKHGLAERLEYYRRARRVLPDNIRIRGEDVVFATAEFPITDDDILDLTSNIGPKSTVEEPAGSHTSPPRWPAASVEPTGMEADALADREIEPASISAEIKRTEEIQTAGGTRTLETTVLSPAGDSPTTPPSWWMSVEDWKPFCFRWLKRVWGSVGGVSFAQVAGLGTIAAGDAANWYIYAGVAAAILIVVLDGAAIISAVLLAIWYFNRKEIVHYKTEELRNLMDPEKKNFGLNIEKK